MPSSGEETTTQSGLNKKLFILGEGGKKKKLFILNNLGYVTQNQIPFTL